jgi:hypothetical protein
MASRLLVPMLALMVVLNASAAALARAAAEYEADTQALTRLDQRSLAFRSACHATSALLSAGCTAGDQALGVVELPLAGSTMSFVTGGTAQSPSTTMVWKNSCIEIVFEVAGDRVRFQDVNDHEAR